MIIEKRDGRIEQFNKEKIISAIKKAFCAVDGNISDYALTKAENIATYIKTKAQDELLTVEEIQDLVEKGLMATKRKDVAKAFILYREERNQNRNQKNPLTKEMKNKLLGANIENQNANLDEMSFGGRKGEASNIIFKDDALNRVMSPRMRYNHLHNRIYVHDLDSYSIGMHNCLTLPIDDLLEKGFNTRQADVRPANSASTAFQLLAVIFQLQSLQQFGGVSVSHLDWTMIPYVRKSFRKHYIDGLKYIEDILDQELFDHIPIDAGIEDNEYKVYDKVYKYAMDMTTKEIEQAAEGMYHNLNTLQSRSGNQLPFTSINLGTCTLPEGRLVIRAILNGCLKGVGKFHKTSIFPCVIFQCMKGVNRKPNEPNYDLWKLALKSTATRLYPNYANCDWSGNAGYDINDPRTYFSTMGCRTANGYDINGFGQLKDGRGNICPVTIIMPTIAMEAIEKFKEEDYLQTKEGKDQLIEYFLRCLDKSIFEAKDALLERFNYICSQPMESAKFMYENHTMAGYIPEEGIYSALKHGTLAVGQIGLAETLQLLIGENHTTQKGMKLAKKIEELFRTRCDQFKKEYKLNFGVYMTPAENLCYTAMKKFKEQYGIIPKVSDKNFFTNSMHVPVWEKVSPFEKIDIESQLTGYSNAGCITYVELDGGMEKNISALETLVNYAMDKDIPYFAINVPNDTCLNCGYTGEFNDKCPECGSTNIQQLRRVTGYLTGNYTTSFNAGKQQEVELRIKHSGLIRGLEDNAE